MTNEAYYIVVGVRKVTETDTKGEAVEYFESICEDEETAREAFRILKRSLVDR